MSAPNFSWLPHLWANALMCEVNEGYTRPRVQMLGCATLRTRGLYRIHLDLRAAR